MLGAVVGDIVGSVYEFDNIRTKNFQFFRSDCFFTDDTVMTFAIENALRECKGDYTNLEGLTIKSMQEYGKKYQNKSYGIGFGMWLKSSNPRPYNSFGNGAAMRISSVAYYAKNIEELKNLANIVTKVTHNHPEGLKGAEATAAAIFLALHKSSKQEIKEYIEKNYYAINFEYDDVKKNYEYNETCQGTVPQAIYCFLISSSFEDAVRTAISIGGDSDTLGAITGAISEAYYGIPDEIKDKALAFLDKNLLGQYNKFSKDLLKN